LSLEPAMWINVDDRRAWSKRSKFGNSWRVFTKR